MSVRIASIVIAISLLALSACAPPRKEVHNVASAQVVMGDADHRPLRSAQVAALSNWIKTPDDWSGYSANIPDRADLEVDMQNADGQSDRLMIYQHEDGSATAYLYHGERLVPLRRHLSSEGLDAFKSMLNHGP